MNLTNKMFYSIKTDILIRISIANFNILCNCNNFKILLIKKKPTRVEKRVSAGAPQSLFEVIQIFGSVNETFDYPLYYKNTSPAAPPAAYQVLFNYYIFEQLSNAPIHIFKPICFLF